MLSMNPIRWRIAILTTLCSFALSACEGNAERYQSHMKRGREYLAAGNLQKARIEAQNALAIEPKNADALFLEGHIAELRGSIREAVSLYQAAIDAQPDHEDARAALAKAFVFGAMPERALEILGPGLIARPDSAELLAARAAARHQMKDDANARADAERAVQLSPGNENAVAVLAALYRQAGDNNRALNLVKKAVARIPTSVDLREVLTSLYLAAGQPGEAEQQLRRIVQLEPREITPRQQLARFLTHAGRLDDAQRTLEDIVRDLPDSDDAKLTLADFIATQRSRAQGEKTLRDFIAHNPRDADLRMGLGTLLQSAGAAQDAVAAYQEVVHLEGTGPKGLVARDRIAAVEASVGHYDQALTIVNDVLRKNARDPDALVIRANIELERNDPADVIVDIRAALRDQPKATSLQRTLARAFLAKGEPALAEDTLRRAVDSAPAEVGQRVELAELLTQTNRADQAISLLEETVRIAPKDSQAREVLVRTHLAKRDPVAARAAAEDLKRLLPDSPVGFYLAGLAAVESNQFDDGRQNLERALELKPGAADVLTALARLEIARGNPSGAVARVQAVVDSDPRNVQALDLLGEVYLAGKDYSHAIETLTRATQLDSGAWMSYRDLALVRIAMSDPKGAQGEYETALRIAPTQSQLILELAGLDEKLGAVDAAIACYERLYGGDSDLKQTAANKIALLLVTYKTDPASLDRARDLTAGFVTSDNGALLDTHGWVRFKRREFDAAVTVLERAVERAPDSRVIRYHLAMAELRVGRRERARIDLESALTGSATFSGADNARATLASLKPRSAG